MLTRRLRSRQGARNIMIWGDLERRHQTYGSQFDHKTPADWFDYRRGNCNAISYIPIVAGHKSQRATAALAMESSAASAMLRSGSMRTSCLASHCFTHSSLSLLGEKAPLLTRSQTKLMISLSVNGSGKWCPSREAVNLESFHNNRCWMIR